MEDFLYYRPYNLRVPSCMKMNNLYELVKCLRLLQI